jgi:hypothetical protein
MTGRNIVLEEAEAVARLVAEGNDGRAVAVIIVVVDYDGNDIPDIHTGHCCNAAALDDPDNAAVNITIGIADAIKGMFEETSR